MRNADYIANFVNRICKSDKPPKSLMTNGSTLFSYVTPIARHASKDGQRIIEMDDRNHSVTTTKHQTLVRRAAQIYGYEIRLVERL